jgi:anti-sigma regulatory factor (Ser/Thr protein kinase)
VDLIKPHALPLTLAAPGLARRYLASRAAAWPVELLDLLVLLTSELVTNAVIHGRRPIELRLSDDGKHIKIEISDGDADPLPRTPDKPPDARVSGRGLPIVDSLADRWGWRPRRAPPGKGRLVRATTPVGRLITNAPPQTLARGRCATRGCIRLFIARTATGHGGRAPGRQPVRPCVVLRCA